MMLQILNLATGYGRHTVARSLSATLPKGQLTCLLGPNGVGKSTLLRTIGGFLPAIAGQVRIAGELTTQLRAHQLSHLLSVVLTERPQIEGLSVEQVVAMGRMPHTGFWGKMSPEDHEHTRRAMQLAGIAHLAQRMAHTLSDGERQKTMVAKALAQDTPLMLMDEPTAFLDFPSKIQLIRLLRHMAEHTGKCILLSTHDVEMALQLAHHLWLLSPTGIHCGTPQALAEDGSLARFTATEGLHFDAQSRTFTLECGADAPAPGPTA